nr:ATP-dependent RNA helicase DBP3-like [Rattus norvegicus]
MAKVCLQNTALNPQVTAEVWQSIIIEPHKFGLHRRQHMSTAAVTTFKKKRRKKRKRRRRKEGRKEEKEKEEEGEKKEKKEKEKNRLNIVVYICNPSTWASEEGSLNYLKGRRCWSGTHA